MGVDLIEHSITEDSLDEAYKIAKALEENMIVEKDNSHEELKNIQDREQRNLADEINRAFGDAEPTIH
jgi:vacuolar-type H+-ATPase subunit E/Vma4